MNQTDIIIDGLLLNSGLAPEARYFLILLSYIPLGTVVVSFIKNYGFGDLFLSYWELVGGVMNCGFYV